jgi:hypothetical protein
MSDRMIKVFIGCGWVAAGLNFFGNLLVATRVGGFNQPILKLVDPRNGAEGLSLTQGELTVVLLVITYGIYRRSRAAALAMLIIFATLKVLYYNQDFRRLEMAYGDSFVISFWFSAFIFMALYLLAVIGTFTWHARRSAAASNSLSA